VLNDCPLTHLSSVIGDPEPLKPSHLLCGRRIVPLPHPDLGDDELSDQDYHSADQLRNKIDRQGLLLQHFRSRWKEYLTWLWEVHRTTGVTEQTVKIGEVVQIHDDLPRNQWKLTVIEDLKKGDDGYIRSVTVRTANGRTNRPIARLYPLEVSADEYSTNGGTEQSTRHVSTGADESTQQQPTRRAVIRARDKLAEWTKMLRRPPEDVTNVD